MNFDQIIQQSRASIEKWDLNVLLPLIASIHPKVIIELGMHQGFSMELWREAFPESLLLGVERDLPTSIAYKASKTGVSKFLWKHNSHDEATYKAVKNWLEPNKLQIDFLFIDGDHSYYGVQKDFEMYSPLVRSGGIIVFHDALYHADKTEEVDEFWDHKIRKKYPRYLEIKASKNSTGIGVIWKDE